MATALPLNNKIRSALVNSEMAAKRMNYGGGYSQRYAYGLNPVMEKMTVDWVPLTKAEFQTVYNALVASKGVDLFSYQPPKSTSVEYWSMQTVNTGQQPGSLLWTISATFTREYDLNP